MARIELAVVFPQKLWNTKMSFVRRAQVCAFERHREFSVTLTGPGWPGWDNAQTLRTNLAWKPVQFDAIWAYKPDACVEPEDHPCKMIVAYNENWWLDWKGLRECKAAGVDAIICHHLNDMERFTEAPDDVMGDYSAKVYHLAHCSDSAYFAKYSKPWSERLTDVLVTGTLSPEFYPLRARVADLIKSRKLRGKVRPHPGLRMHSLAECDNQMKDYAKAFGDTKIAVVCSSIYKYGLAKYVEAAAAGCCVCGDIPPDFAGTIGPAMLEIKMGWSDDQIISAIEAARDKTEWTHERARGCQKAARKWHSMTKYCEGVAGILKGG